MNRSNILLYLLFVIILPVFSQRKEICLNNDWSFRFSHDVQEHNIRKVNLPHTWNAQDALSGQLTYKRGGETMRRPFI